MEAEIWTYEFWTDETDGEKLKKRYEALLLKSGFCLVGFTEFEFKPHGYTCVWIVAESHFAIHTFPEERKTFCQLSSCNYEKFLCFKRMEKRHRGKKKKSSK